MLYGAIERIKNTAQVDGDEDRPRVQPAAVVGLRRQKQIKFRDWNTIV